MINKEKCMFTCDVVTYKYMNMTRKQISNIQNGSTIILKKKSKRSKIHFCFIYCLELTISSEK